MFDLILLFAFSLSTVMLATALLIFLRNRSSAPRLLHYSNPTSFPCVSVLIPARNEAINLTRILPFWEAVDYPHWELIILDDHSQDQTHMVLQSFQPRISQLRILSGEPLPLHWRGKNWACQQLANAAHGDILLFVDSDVEPSPLALRQSIAALQSEGADLLSAFGTQRQQHWATRAVIPLVMEFPICALVPLREVLQLPYPSVSAAVGQWLAFTRIAYERCGGHAAVAGEIVEDLALARLAKTHGLRLLPAWAQESIAVQMYSSFRELWNGFAKNAALLAGPGWVGALASLSVVIFLYILPLLAPILLGPLGLIPFLLFLVLRLGVAKVWRHSPLSILWHIPGALLLLALVIRSALHPLRPVAWKGRPLCPIPAKQ